MAKECKFDEYLTAKKLVETVENDAGAHVDTSKSPEQWYQRVWRPMAAIVFLVVVVFDFVIMPSVVQITNESKPYAEVIKALDSIDDQQIKMEFLRKVDIEKKTWMPLTTIGGGLFFASFGVILGAAAWTRGMEKTAREKNVGKAADAQSSNNAAKIAQVQSHMQNSNAKPV